LSVFRKVIVGQAVAIWGAMLFVEDAMLPPIVLTDAALVQDRARAERMQDHLVPPLAQVT